LKNKLVFLITFTSIFLAGISYLIYSVLWMDIQSTKGMNASLSTVSTIKDVVLKGGTLYLGEKDINSLLELYADNLPKQGNIKIENINCSIIDNKITFYLHLRYSSLRLQLNTQGSLNYEQSTISYTPDYFKLGKLPLPKKLILNKLGSHVSVNAAKERIEINKDSIPIKIEGLMLRDNKLEIKLKHLIIKEPKANTPVKPDNSTNTPEPSNPKNIQEQNGSPKPFESNSSTNTENSSSPVNIPTPNSSPNTVEPNSSTNTDKPSNPANIAEPNSSPKTVELSIEPSDSGKVQEQITNEAEHILIIISDQLKKIYSAVKTTNEKQIIAVVQNAVTKLLQNPAYSYEADASNVMIKYEKLTDSEQEDLRTTILSHIDATVLMVLQEYLDLDL
jgi:hypothetical protein